MKSLRSVLLLIQLIAFFSLGVSDRIWASTPAAGNITVQVYAYNADGTNTGTGRLTQHIKLGVAVTGTADQNVTFTLQGAGTISGTTYQAPATMPASPTVTLTASLTDAPSVAASYTFTLVNPVPVIYSVTGTLNRASTNPVTIGGDGIVPGTVVLVNGAAVQSTYQTSGSLLAQVPVAATASGMLPITLQNPSPVGGASAVFQAPIATPTMQLNAFNADGTNTGTGRLTQHMKLGVAVKGTADQNVTFALQGAGSISGTSYQAPATMPANPSVKVTATLTDTPSVSASYSFTLVNPVPVIYSVTGTLNRASTNPVTISGDGIIPGTVVLVNGAAVQSTYQSSGSLLAQIPVTATASGMLPIMLQNPSPVGGVSAAFQAAIALPAMQLNAFTADGTNTGTGRLTQHIQLGVVVKGTADQTVTYALQGAGSISGTTYQAPATMPASSTVTITATLTDTPSISASYTFTLVNPVPVIYSVTGTLNRASTNPVTISGNGIVPGTIVLVNGIAVQSTYQSSGSLLAQIPVSASASGTLPITLQNPLPVGGTSAVFQAPIALPTMQINAFNADGTNTGTARLTQHMTLGIVVKGTADQNVTFTLQGAGSISGTTYQAPATMPPSPTVTITATLTDTPSVSASYTFALVNPVPVIYSVTGTLNRASTNPVTISGNGIVPGTVVLVNGAAVQSTYQSGGSLLAQVPVAGTASGTLPITLQNPAPAGGTSAVFQAPIATPGIQLSAFNADGTNTGSARLTQHMTLGVSVKGTGDQIFTLTLQGAGSISGTTYQAPAIMPANPTVTITATLTDTPTVSTAYTFTLVNPVPVIYSVNGYLRIASTNPVTITGDGIVPGTTVLVNGAAVQSTYVSSTTLTAQIPVAASASGTLPVSLQNPAPVGGGSNTFQASITLPTIQIYAYNASGANTGVAQVGLNTQLIANVTGAISPGVSYPVQWKVQGSGVISSSGLYSAPATMPASSNVTVVASLASNPAASASYSFSLNNPVPSVNATAPVQVPSATATSLTVFGHGFTPGMTLLANGQPVGSSYLSSTSLSVQIPALPAGTTSVALVAQTPAPGGGQSAPFTVLVTNDTTVNAQVTVQPGLSIPEDFVGLSAEWGEAQTIAGSVKYGRNNIFRQLLSNLQMGIAYPFLIRVGGGSTDLTGEPTAGVVQPLADLANDMSVHFTLGVNLGSDNPQLAKDQAQFYAAQMPSGSLEAIEIGNEPDGYAITGQRSPSYTEQNFFGDFNVWANAVLPVLPSGLKLMGPAWSAIRPSIDEAAFEQQDGSSVSMISQHYYVGAQAVGKLFPPDFLLRPTAASAVGVGVAPFVRLAHADGQVLRMGEMNSINSSGVAGISDSFSSALWAIDTMFELAKTGVDGVNWHGLSGCNYCSFAFNYSSVGAQTVYSLQQVKPLYYGMLFFREATQSKAQLLPVNYTTTSNLKIWSTLGQDGKVRVVIINKDQTFAGHVAITLPGYGDAQMVQLVAPSFGATSGLSLGGQTFDGSVDGTLVGDAVSTTISQQNGVYSVPVQPTSAVLLTLQ